MNWGEIRGKKKEEVFCRVFSPVKVKSLQLETKDHLHSIQKNHIFSNPLCVLINQDLLNREDKTSKGEKNSGSLKERDRGKRKICLDVTEAEEKI